MNCRHCNKNLEHVFVDLGYAPHSNAYRSELKSVENSFPLKVLVCDNCWLVQTEDASSSEDHFHADYAYFSSISSTWLAHAKKYTQGITDRLNLDSNSFVVELASNDGYLLKNFVEMNIPCLGIEPTESTADHAISIGVPTLKEFFGEESASVIAKSHGKADLIAGNNVYAHVPDINDFTRGIKALLKPEGTVTLEFPHLLQLIKNHQFDTIYHEHYSYLSLTAVRSIFNLAGLDVYNVEELTTHGGSLRVYGSHKDYAKLHMDQSVIKVLNDEVNAGLKDQNVYRCFQKIVEKTKLELVQFLIESKKAGKKVGCYGAAAKGNTLLNFAGIKKDLIDKVYDAAPSKIGKYLPGSHIEVAAPHQIEIDKPDFLIILPWNIKEEVIKQNSFISEWGGSFVVFIPGIQIL